MTWKSGNSDRIVPGNWAAIRRRVLERDGGICHVCRQPGADEVDHLVNVARGGSHELDNLAAIHRRPCHTNKTALEAAASRRYLKERRAPERHPGIIERPDRNR